MIDEITPLQRTQIDVILYKIAHKNANIGKDSTTEEKDIIINEIETLLNQIKEIHEGFYNIIKPVLDDIN